MAMKRRFIADVWCLVTLIEVIAISYFDADPLWMAIAFINWQIWLASEHRD